MDHDQNSEFVGHGHDSLYKELLCWWSEIPLESFPTKQSGVHRIVAVEYIITLPHF